MIVNKPVSFSDYLLILANLIPLIGVVYFAWNTQLVLALFWIENLVIGVFTIIKMTISSLYNKDKSGFFIIPFFVFHYGVFCAAHGKLLVGLLDYKVLDAATLFKVSDNGIQALFLESGAVLITFIHDFSPVIWVGIIGLVLSKLGAFIEYFILRGEIFNLSVNKLMSQPYSQIIVMHVGLIIGALVLQKFGSPVWLLATIVVVKMFIDFRQFQTRHNAPINRPSNPIKLNSRSSK